MKLRLVRHLWGVDISQGITPYIPKWRERRYEVLEISSLRLPDPITFHEVRQAEGFEWIAQAFSNMFVNGGTAKEHLLSLRQQVEECLRWSPLFINAHTGSDSWTQAEAEEFYGGVEAIERDHCIAICHETHRSRYFGNPWNTKRILDRFPDIRLTCDFSHWVCVAERLLQDCAEIIHQAAHHCLHVHARVGYEQGPQVSDPRAPEWTGHLEAHERWWEQVWKSQHARSLEASTLTPEFGPFPYMQVIPYSRQPLVDLSEICDWMATRQADHFGSFFQEQEEHKTEHH